MQWDIIILVIFFVIILPISLKIKLSINILRNKGQIIVYLFSLIPVYNQTFKVDNGFIKFIKNPQKIKKVKISFNKEAFKKINNNTNIILNSQIVKQINISTNFGIKNQPYYVAIISGIYNSIVGVFLSINCAKRNIINSHSKLRTYFNYTYLKSNINLKIKVSIYEILKIYFQIILGAKI